MSVIWKRFVSHGLCGAVLATVVMAMLLVGGPSAIAAGASSDRAIADAINVRASDVPGFTAQPSSGGSTNLLDAKFKEACPEIASTPHRAFISSPKFQRSSELEVQAVQSQVQIDSSSSIATADVGHLGSPSLAACFRRVFEGLRLTSPNGTVATITGVSVTPLPLTVRGASSADGIRIQMVMTINTTLLPIQMEEVGLSAGRDVLNLLTVSLNEPLSSSIQHRLESLILHRALAEPH